MTGTASYVAGMDSAGMEAVMVSEQADSVARAMRGVAVTTAADGTPGVLMSVHDGDTVDQLDELARHVIYDVEGYGDRPEGVEYVGRHRRPSGGDGDAEPMVAGDEWFTGPESFDSADDGVAEDDGAVSESGPVQPGMAEHILSTAAYTIGERGATHGAPERTLDLIASYWSTFLGLDDGQRLQPAEVAAMMTLLKVARLSSNPAHMDNWVDIAGYAALGGEAVS